MEEISRGAEAVLYADGNHILKHRIKKPYRIREIDIALRKTRTRKEAKILEKIPVPAPELLNMDDTDMKLAMSRIRGEKVRDVLEKDIHICKDIGIYIASMHNHGIIHGDLTTSNMIMGDKLYFIDFGLSYFSDKVEDKAVDLHVLHQALISKHHSVHEEGFKLVLEGYCSKSGDQSGTLKRLEIVESRGRNKSK